MLRRLNGDARDQWSEIVKTLAYNKRSTIEIAEFLKTCSADVETDIRSFGVCVSKFIQNQKTGITKNKLYNVLLNVSRLEPIRFVD